MAGAAGPRPGADLRARLALQRCRARWPRTPGPVDIDRAAVRRHGTDVTLLDLRRLAAQGPRPRPRSSPPTGSTRRSSTCGRSGPSTTRRSSPPYAGPTARSSSTRAGARGSLAAEISDPARRAVLLRPRRPRAAGVLGGGADAVRQASRGGGPAAGRARSSPPPARWCAAMSDFTMPSLGADMDSGADRGVARQAGRPRAARRVDGRGRHRQGGGGDRVVPERRGRRPAGRAGSTSRRRHSPRDTAPGGRGTSRRCRFRRAAPEAAPCEAGCGSQEVPTPIETSPMAPSTAGDPYRRHTRRPPAARSTAASPCRRARRRPRSVTGTGRGGRITRRGRRGTVAHRPRVSPYARRLAAELGVDLTIVTGTGTSGTVRAEDVRAAAAARATGGPGRPCRPQRPRSERATIAALMSRSKREIPHYYVTTTVDMHAVVTWLRDDQPRARRLASGSCPPRRSCAPSRSRLARCPSSTASGSTTRSCPARTCMSGWRSRSVTGLWWPRRCDTPPTSSSPP